MDGGFGFIVAYLAGVCQAIECQKNAIDEAVKFQLAISCAKEYWWPQNP